MSSELRPRELNVEIINCIKAARQKLSVDLTAPKENLGKTRDESVEQLYKPGSSLVEKTINTLKQKIDLLNNEKEQLSNQITSCCKIYQQEIDTLKHQLIKYIEKDFEITMSNDNNIPELKAQISSSNDKLNKKNLQLQIYIERCKQSEIINNQLRDRCAKLQHDVDQLTREKDKHIELNIEDKLNCEEELKRIENQKQRKQQHIKRLQQQNITLKKEIHQLHNQQRTHKNNEALEQKYKDDYEFQMKEMSQKYNAKIAKQQKEIAMLRKTIDKLKDKNNQSDVAALANSENQIELLKEKVMDLETKLSLKQIQIEKMISKVESINKIMQEKQSQLKKFQQIIIKKQDTEQNLLNKLAKNGLPSKEFKDHSKNTLKDLDFKTKYFNNLNESDTPTFTSQKLEIKQPVFTNQKTAPDVDYSSDKCSESVKSDRVEKLVKEERALADLKSAYKNLDCSDLSLNQIMQEIRRKGDKINELRQAKNDQS